MLMQLIAFLCCYWQMRELNYWDAVGCCADQCILSDRLLIMLLLLVMLIHNLNIVIDCK